MKMSIIKKTIFFTICLILCTIKPIRSQIVEITGTAKAGSYQMGTVKMVPAGIGFKSIRFENETEILAEFDASVGNELPAFKVGQIKFGNVSLRNSAGSGTTIFPDHLFFNHSASPISILSLNPTESSMHTDEFIMNGMIKIQENKNLSATPAGHIAQIYNTSTGDSPDVLALKVGKEDPGSGSNFITFFEGDDGALGRIEGNGSGGISFMSGGADFAEFIPIHLDEEDFSAGDVIGIVDGKISFNTANASKVMVITDTPIVIGNQQEDDDSNFQMVGFIGQVAVRVRGKVNAGDWIVASSLNDGTGIGIGPAEITLDHKIVGQAWESNEDPGVKRINTVIGLDHSQAKDLIIEKVKQELKTQQSQNENQQLQIKDLQRQIDQLKDAIIESRN